MTKEGKLRSELIEIVLKYLGPASERFIDRQIRFHLDKEPNDLEKEDIESLTEWIKVSLGILTDDKKLVDECTNELLNLSR